MEPRLSVITLGVSDLDRSKAFYESLGFEDRSRDDDIVFFQAGGMILALWDRVKLAEDSGISDDAGGWGGITLAHNVGSPEAVDALLEEASAAGATIVHEASKAFWGGYNGVFHDPDGHAWEIAHNPYWPIADDGSVTIPTA